MKALCFIFCLMLSFPSYAQNYRQGSSGGRTAAPQQRQQAARPSQTQDKTNRELTNSIGDTAFFRKYIAANPHVLPDIKLKGNAEW